MIPSSAMTCHKCGFRYVPDLPENVKAHKESHDKIVNGLYAPEIKSDKIVWEKGDYLITVVDYLSPHAQKKRAEKAGVVAHRDMPFDASLYNSNESLDERNIHIFLQYRKNRIIGYLIVERRYYIQGYTWEEYENAGGKELQKENHLWSIGLVWVHSKHRIGGKGAKLIKVAASYFDIEVQSLAWYTPFTDDGKKLAKSLCPKSFIVAK